MPGTFSGLEIALRSLRSHQRAIEVVDHNIANVNNEGYSRQKAVLATTAPYTVPAMNREESVGQVGTGVQVQRIQRYSSEYLSAQMRHELPRQERWRTLQEATGQMEVIFQEPSDTGIAAAMGRFWESWSQLSATSEDLASRTAVAEAASNLAFSIRNADSRLRDLQSDMDLQIRQTVERINDIAVELAGLNDPISKVQAFGDQPNDLRDRRDALLDELSQLVDLNYYENEDGTVTANLGGHPLVMGDDYSRLDTRTDSANGMWLKVVWPDTGSPLTVRGVALSGGLDAVEGQNVGGSLGGAFYARDVVIPDFIGKLDALAAGLIDSVNGLHATGFGAPDSGSIPPDRPGSTLGTVVLSPTGPVNGMVTDGTLYPPTEGLGAGTYHLVTRDNAGVMEFQLQDWTGRGVAVNNASGTGMTDQWQALAPVLGSVYDTGRGVAVDFGAAAGTAGEVATFQYNNFFSGRRAGEIDVSAWVRDTPLNIATASTGDASGDGSIALAIARLRTASVMGDGSTLDEYYNAGITDLGLRTKQATAMLANAEGLTEHLQRRKDEVSGVDMDEETVNLIQYQRAYQGAARVMTALDEMLDRLINGTGRVGL